MQAASFGVFAIGRLHIDGIWLPPSTTATSMRRRVWAALGQGYLSDRSSTWGERLRASYKHLSPHDKEIARKLREVDLIQMIGGVDQRCKQRVTQVLYFSQVWFDATTAY